MSQFNQTNEIHPDVDGVAKLKYFYLMLIPQSDAGEYQLACESSFQKANSY